MPANPMKKTSIILAVLLVTGCAAVASEEMRQVQEELRKRNLYFGDIDGKATTETEGALRRYQERKGFPASGELCPLTRQSLNLAQLSESAEATNWPEETVLKSDAARRVSEADQKFLEAIAEETPQAEDIDEEMPPAPLVEREPVQVEAPAAPVAENGAAPATTPEPRYEQLVRDYLAASEENNLQQELRFYSDRVDYFDHGKVDLGFVRKDVQNYHDRWPERDYELLSLQVLPGKGGERVVRFRIAFKVKNQRHSVSGKTENTFRIREEGGELKFTALKEKRLRR
jgi:peptidoglycan hydrolase-like protein with peptidoglycan-binding domain